MTCGKKKNIKLNDWIYYTGSGYEALDRLPMEMLYNKEYQKCFGRFIYAKPEKVGEKEQFYIYVIYNEEKHNQYLKEADDTIKPKDFITKWPFDGTNIEPLESTPLTVPHISIDKLTEASTMDIDTETAVVFAQKNLKTPEYLMKKY